MQIEEIAIKEVDILDKIKKSNAKEDDVIKVVEEMKKAKVKVLRDKEWRKEDRLILRDGQVYVSKNEK